MTGASVEDLQRWAQGDGQPSARQLLALARRLRDPNHPPGADPLPDEPIEEGHFVVARTNELGIGKCVSIDDADEDTEIEAAFGVATVEYFDSVARRVERKVAVEDLVTVRLAHQTRCYVYDEEDDRWRMGRVSRLKDGDRIIELPDRESTDVPQEHLYVRWSRPVDDPIETLKVKGQETVFFRNQRGPFVRALLDQRAASRGIDGLLSSSIPLLRHQVEPVRRMLEEPVPRYLLADETSQGPSTPAGVVLRQLVLDGDTPRCLVLVPDERVEAWTSMLDRAFNVFSLDGTVDVHGYRDAAEGEEEPDEEWTGTEPDVLLVDDAHRAAEWASSSPDRFAALEDAAHAAQGLLLLSDAAVHRQAPQTRALLHLLDPDRYAWEDDLEEDDLEEDDLEEGDDAFQETVDRRTATGELVERLDAASGDAEDTEEDAFAGDAGTLRNVIDDVLDAAESDPVQEAATELRDLLPAEGDVEDPGQVQELVDAVRTGLRERFRLHPRAFRIRQSDAGAVLSDLRAPDEDARLVDYGLDEREATAHEHLEAWRERAAETAETEDDERRYAVIYRHLAEAAGADLGLFADLARLRRDGKSVTDDAADRLEMDYTAAEQRAVITPPLLDDEADRLDAMIEAAEGEVNEFDFDHTEWAEQFVDLNVDPVDACVVYVSRPSVAREVREALARTCGAEAVAANLADDPPDQIDEEIRRFRDDAECYILVCDRSAETGPVLPFTTHLVHYDLPWDPVRIERRIQRLCPIGRRDEPLRTNVYLGPDLGDDGPSVFETWLEVLRDGFDVFERSLAGWSNAASAIGADAATRIFRDGADEDLPDAVRESAREARDRHDRQHVFEAVNLAADAAEAYADDLNALEERSRELYNRMDPWITKALQFHRSKREYPQGVIKYEPQYDGRTLVPFDVILNRFLPQTEKPTTFHRSCAVRPEGGLPAVTMFRVGHPFLSALADYFSWDDRGRTYALWRESEAWAAAGQDDRLFFRFDFVVEADPEPARDALSGDDHRPEALQQRLNEYFPPAFETVFVDRDGNPVTQDGLLKLLRTEPQRKSKGGNDRNVKGERLPVLDDFVPPDEWADCCQTARDAAATALREHADLKSRSQEAARRVDADAADRLRRVRARRNGEAGDAADRQERIHDALRAGVEHPNVSLDSVGVVILSGDSIPIEEGEDVG
jgi:ATP-dependent helicase HepA